MYLLHIDPIHHSLSPSLPATLSYTLHERTNARAPQNKTNQPAHPPTPTPTQEDASLLSQAFADALAVPASSSLGAAVATLSPEALLAAQNQVNKIGRRVQQGTRAKRSFFLSLLFWLGGIDRRSPPHSPPQTTNL